MKTHTQDEHKRDERRWGECVPDEHKRDERSCYACEPDGRGRGERARGERGRGERGQMTVLIIGFTAVVLLMVVVVTDISKVFLVRRDLDSTADGAVLAAANGLAAIYAQGGSGENAQIDPDEARRLTAEYLDSVDASDRFDGLDWTADVNGTTVTVHLSSAVDLPFEPPGWQGSADIASDAAAVVPIR